MAARSCAKRAHQLAVFVLSNGVGPSLLPTAASTCRCHLQQVRTSGASSTRHFSVTRLHREQETSTWAQQNNDPRSGKSNSSRAARKSVLIEEVADAEPTLEYLDSLKPRVQRSQRYQQRSRRDNSNPFAKASTKGNPEDKQWERTKARLNASFTRDQLLSLARAATLPGSYSTKVRKDELVRRIMIHRFGMEDARERADREKREDLQKQSVHISFRPSELYLLLAKGSGKVRQEASKAQVAILPRAPKKEAEQAGAASEQLGFWIRGKDQGIAKMKDWVQSFKESIKTKQEQVTLFSADAQAASGEALPHELVRFISQLSRCFVEASPIQDGKVKLNLAYLDERSAQKAVLLMRQYHAENAEAMQRIGAAGLIDSLDTTKQYSMLPFVHNEPTSWIKQADDLLYRSQSDVSFRIAHVPDLDAFSLLSTAKLSAMKIAGWNSQGQVQMEEPFQALLDIASSSIPAAEAGKEVECSATLGHVLFSGGGLTLADEGLSEEEVLSRLQDPLTAPRPGIWSMQPTLDWACNFRTRFGREASRFVPATLFPPQKNASLDIWLEKQNYSLVGNGTSGSSSEKMILVYQPADARDFTAASKLEVVLSRQKSQADAAQGAKGGWNIERASWVGKAESDVMIPEKSVDLRLSTKTMSALQDEARAAVEESLASFLDVRRSAAKVEKELVAEEIEVEAEEADGESEVNDLLGSGTEVVDQPVVPAVSTAARSNSLPPSTLRLPSTGTLALESATRVTVQTYQQRSRVAPAAPQPTTPVAMPEATLIEAANQSGGSTEITPETAESRPAADAVVQDASDDAATPIAENEAAAAPITTAEASAESSSSEPALAEDPQQVEASAPSQLLLCEISQDLITKTTTESLRIVWHSTTPPTWKDAVEPLTALLDRHDASIR